MVGLNGANCVRVGGIAITPNQLHWPMKDDSEVYCPGCYVNVLG